MDFKDWISIFAILASPLIAVGITLLVETRRQKRRDKLELFKTMMTQRGFSASYAWVDAINSLVVVFSDDQSVISAVNDFMRIVNTQPFNNEEYENKKIKLLEKIAASLGYKKNIDWEQLRNAYYPQWMINEVNFNTQVKNAQLIFANNVLTATVSAAQQAEQHTNQP